MAFVIATSLFLAILDIGLLKFLIFLDSFPKILSPRIDRWIQDGVWQLQRRANEAHQQGKWIHLTREVPLTNAGETLAELPLASVALLETTTTIKQTESRSSGSSTPTLSLESLEPHITVSESSERLLTEPKSDQ